MVQTGNAMEILSAEMPASSPEALWSFLRRIGRFVGGALISPAVLFADLFRREGKLERHWMVSHVLLAMLLTIASLTLVLVGQARVRRALAVYEAASSLRSAPAALPFVDIINMEAARNGLDPALVAAIIQNESSFDPDATSPMGAKGLMQILPATWRTFNPKSACDGLHDPPAHGEDCIYDPAANVRTGTAYFKQLVDDFKGDAVMAIAAYNSGVAAVALGVAGGGPGGLGKNGAGIFLETQAFVRQVLSRWGIWRGAERPAPSPHGMLLLKTLMRAGQVLQILSFLTWAILATWLARRAFH